MVQDNTLHSLINSVKELLSTYSKDILQDVDVQVVKDCEDVYRVMIPMKHCMAQVLIEKATYAPYSSFAFEVVENVQGNLEIVYCWYDNERSSNKEILNQLEKGIHFANSL